uniref:Uncharacterized protein n=1 Tax=Fagus sylvatica TaxID=28930 RepID=A0A2N9EIL9_FAGSY
MDLVVVLWKVFAPMDLVVVLWKVSAPMDLIVALWKIFLDSNKSYEMSCTSDTIHTSEDDANVGIIGKIVVASLPPRSIAGRSSSVGASAISDEIVDFFREFDKRRLNPHPEWHFRKFNGPFVSFGDFWVLSDSAPYLRQLTKRHGNFVAKFKLGAGFGGPMLSLLGSVLAAMDKSDLGSVTKVQIFSVERCYPRPHGDSLAMLTTYREEMVSTGVTVPEFECGRSLFDSLIH